jgi:hypothetical protein
VRLRRRRPLSPGRGTRAPLRRRRGPTLDESALLLELEDVYWSREGLLSVQITLAVIAVLGALPLGLRFLRRGEQLVLERGEE